VIAVFRTAFELWHREGTRANLSQLIPESLEQTKLLFTEERYVAYLSNALPTGTKNG
jgi:hypothetical protein